MKRKKYFLILALVHYEVAGAVLYCCPSGTQNEGAAAMWDIVTKVKEHIMESYSGS